MTGKRWLIGIACLWMTTGCPATGGGGNGGDADAEPAESGAPPSDGGVVDIGSDPDADSVPDDGPPEGDAAVPPDSAVLPPDAGPPPDAALPGCADDVDCADPLGQTCAAGQCVDNPCAVNVFSFDPGGTVYDEVHVAGTFNDWPGERGTGLQMAIDPGSGLWFAKQRFDNGEYQYKFVLYAPGSDEPEWIRDPSNPVGVDDNFGGQNSVLTVDCAACETDADCDAGVCLGGGCQQVAACEPGFDWRDAVMYFAMVDRFYDSDGQADPVPGATGGDAARGASGQYEGGDLQGLVDKMPYLSDLGVTALWITAPFENRDQAGAAIDPQADNRQYSGYHGYWPSPDNIVFDGQGGADPRPRVESRIGTEDDLRQMIAAAHGSQSANGDGIKVLFDYVMNHVDLDSGLYRAHPDWFARGNQNGDFTLQPDPGTRFRTCGPENLWEDDFWGTRCAFTPYLPPFAFTEAPDALRWSVNDAAWWATEYGIDGYRLDAIKHVPLEWLIQLVERLQRDIPEPAGGRFYLVGETFNYDDRGLLARFVEPGRLLDGQFDFPFKARLCEALFRPDGDIGAFAGWLDGNDTFYGPGAIMTTWIGNHDVPRPIHFASGQIPDCRSGSFPGNGWTNDYPQPDDAAPYERLGLAFAVMMTNPGVPLIYYGDEIGLAGGGDPDNRRMMPWNDDDLRPAQRRLRTLVGQLARLRARYPSLGRGTRITRPGTTNDVWIYTRLGCDGDPPLTIVINRADAPRDAQLPPGRYVDLLSNQADVEGGVRNLPPRSVMVLRPALVGG